MFCIAPACTREQLQKQILMKSDVPGRLRDAFCPPASTDCAVNDLPFAYQVRGLAEKESSGVSAGSGGVTSGLEGKVV
jgi:hypothetical protein